MHLIRNTTEKITFLLFFVFPTTILFVPKAPGIIFNIFFGIGLIYFIYNLVNKDNRNVHNFIFKYKYILICLWLPFIVDTASKIAANNYDNLFGTAIQRLALTSFILFWFVSVNHKKLRFFDSGILIAAIVSGVWFLFISDFGSVRPNNVPHNLLNYTNIIVLFGIYSLYSISFDSCVLLTDKFNKTLRLFAFGAASIAIVLSQSKGPILSYLILVFLFAIRANSFRINKKATFGVIIFVVVLAAVAISFSSYKDRFVSSFSAVQNTLSVLDGKKPAGTDGSTRIRIQLWHASILMAKDNFWLGDGSREFSQKLEDLNSAGLISDEATWATKERTFVQAHNEIFQTLSETGFLGLLSLLILYLVPIVFFYKQSRGKNINYPITEAGLSFCIAIILFGLTVTVFTAPWMTAIYGIFLSFYLSTLGIKN